MWSKSVFSMALLTVNFAHNLACMQGNFGLFCRFSLKVPRIDVVLHFNAIEKN